MRISFAPRGVVQIDDARIIYRNFRGEKGQYNRNGERSFSVVIPNMDIAEQLLNDINEYGKGWNVKIKAPREEGDEPFIHLPVKVNMEAKIPPRIYLRSGKSRVRVTEDWIADLDDIEIDHVDFDIRPYDGVMNDGSPFRTAYLKAMEIYQIVDRFEARYAEEEHPEE